ncbi:MAG TPA: class I SAM-dependent methyltransferase [Vicinamibacterales bacterium]
MRTQTRRSFGYQWTEFGEMTEQFRGDFLNYIHPLGPEFFPGKRGLDAGCGFGRHLFHAARFGARMTGLDFSRAIERAHDITRGEANVRLVQGDILRPPFEPGAFDFVYSLGVLHHTVDPEGAFQALRALVRPGGSIFVWVYSKSRRWTNAFLEMARAITSRLPFPLTRALSWCGAVVDTVGFIWPYRLLRRIAGPGVDRFVLPRVRVYAKYPFQVCYADWFDRLSAPIRYYYDGDDLKGWAARAGLVNVSVSQTGLYGWRLYGEVPPQ